MKQARLIGALILTILLVIVVLQNTDSVETRFLFVTVTMPRAVLLFSTALLGFATGILTSLIWMRKKEKSTDSS